ncbi:MAG TPA: helix-turn-helix domain-containing protein [Thermoplasmata archaeon]|nr:helix-turn-helix domain-containing protein [Thermoplasmata archaeon]
MSVCRLRVQLPEGAWVARFSRENPDVSIEMLSRLDLGANRSLSEVRLHVPGPGPWAETLGAADQVEKVELLASGPSEVRLRVIHRTSPLVPIFRDLRLMRRFPFSIRGGEAVWFVTASEGKIRQLLDRLSSRTAAVTLESVRHDEATTATETLTPRQNELFQRAMAAGYFDVPRKITLTRLAGQEGMAISSLSEALAVVEKKLLDRRPPLSG